ncbi:hypothetical protein AALB52_04725 [Lachnospiraceae bacterium 38-14]
MTVNKALDNIISMKTEIEYESSDTRQMKRIKCDSLNIAIKALKEIQQYRAIGTVKYFRECADILNKTETDELAKIIDEWILYHKIGTVEECREAKERQKPKKYKKIHPCKSVTYYQCLCCNGLLHINENFCGECGQAILWEDE